VSSELSIHPPLLSNIYVLYVLVEEDGKCHQVRAGEPADVTVHLPKHLLQVGQAVISNMGGRGARG